MSASRLNLVEDRLFDQALRTYDEIIVNSHFTKKWIEKRCQRRANVLHPMVAIDEFVQLPKENILLTVGRFFIEDHSKKQLEMIETFKKLSENGSVRNWEFHLVGGVNDEVKNQEYLKECMKMAEGSPIFFHVNAEFKVLKELYGRSKIFWCATGFNEDEDEHPDRMEHFGITTIEAMSAGCVPVVVNKGGQPEIVRDDKDGFLWNRLEELKAVTLRLMKDKVLWKRLSESAVQRSKDFSSERFEESLQQITGELFGISSNQ
jgi:glycosyltransferase involved in cell wall biosynthesis